MTVTCELPAGVFGVLLPPPQPSTVPAKTTSARTQKPRAQRRRRPARAIPKTNPQSATAYDERCGAGRCIPAVITPVCTVSVVVAVFPPLGATVAGVKLHVLAAGNPEHPKLTCWLKPFCGVTVTVAIPVCPCFTVTVAGLTPMVKFGVFTVCVSTADADPSKLASPPYTAVMEWVPLLNDDVVYVA